MCGESQIDKTEPNNAVETDKLNTPEQNAQLLMSIFVNHFKLLTGEALLTNKLSGVWYDKQKSEEDMVSGIEYAKKQEWITPLDDAFRLTEAGYASAKQQTT